MRDKLSGTVAEYHSLWPNNLSERTLPSFIKSRMYIALCPTLSPLRTQPTEKFTQTSPGVTVAGHGSLMCDREISETGVSHEGQPRGLTEQKGKLHSNVCISTFRGKIMHTHTHTHTCACTHTHVFTCQGVQEMVSRAQVGQGGPSKRWGFHFFLYILLF